MHTARVLSLLLVGLAQLPLLAQPASPPAALVNWATNRPAYMTQIEHVGGPGLLPADFAYVTFGTNKFGFAMPEGFRLDTKDGQKVTLISSDLNCQITFRLLESVPTADNEPDPAYYRQLLLDQRPGGKIVDEFSLPAVSRRGPAFDLLWNAARNVPRRERVVFVASTVGVLEFSLTSSLEKFESGRQAFGTLLLTFRVPEADGRLRMPVFSDRL
jgi:hypothetical protein